MREIVLDTETTGLDPAGGDRIVEIGCVELVNHIPSGEHLHVYVNPERDMPQAAFEVHGLSVEFLSDKPKFGEIADIFLNFIGHDTLVIHNANFDMGFLNAELGRLDRLFLSMDRVVDTLMLARRKHPGAQNSLDALCRRYDIDNSARTKHGALLDAEILAQVYAELIGGKQAHLDLTASARKARRRRSEAKKADQRTEPLAARLSSEEMQAHRAFVKTLGKQPIWNSYFKDETP